MSSVLIAGGGPTGLMLAGELALAGVDVTVVERRVGPELEGTRARGLHAGTIAVLDQRGIAERFLSEGRPMQVQSFAMIPLALDGVPARHPYGLALGQQHVERLLGEWVDGFGVEVRRGREVTGFAEGDGGVDVELSDGASVRAGYLVGCDGARSSVRRAAGIDFPGEEPSISSLIAEVRTRDEPAWGIRRTAAGQHGIGPLGDGRVGVVVSERYEGQAGEPTLDELRRALVGVWGTDFGVHDPTWMSRFTDAARQAASYRRARVLVAGDAAHVHYPVGGQGLDLGIQDAVNLGWKLAQVAHGTSPDTLLDTYQAERHPVAASVLRTTLAMTALTRSEARIDALRDSVTELLGMDEPRRRLAARVAGLDVAYDLGGGHPLVGRRMPDLDLRTPDGPTRVSGLLHDARPVLVTLTPGGAFDVGAWQGRVRRVDARHDGPVALPVVGEVPPPPAVVIRPDGFVAWVGDPAGPDLPGVLETWFGRPPGARMSP